MECVSSTKLSNLCYSSSLNCEAIDDFKLVNLSNVIGTITHDDMVLTHKTHEGFSLPISIHTLVILSPWLLWIVNAYAILRVPVASRESNLVTEQIQ